MADSLRLLTIHAHPDDESSKGAPTIARYASEGVETVLVCATGGEEGDILNPAMDRPEVAADLSAVRLEELRTAVRAIGFSRFHMLGYRDSGMADTESNTHPDCFAMAPLDEAVGRLVALIRAERPHVIITYGDDHQGYQHPDHLRVHDITGPAFDAASDPDVYPDVGDPWQPLKLYYSVRSRARTEALHRAYVDHDIESPIDQRLLQNLSIDHRITTRVDIAEFYPVRSAALRAHATQVDPSSNWWFQLPDEVAAAAYPFDDYILARSEVATEIPESDLFAGISDRIST